MVHDLVWTFVLFNKTLRWFQWSHGCHNRYIKSVWDQSSRKFPTAIFQSINRGILETLAYNTRNMDEGLYFLSLQSVKIFRKHNKIPFWEKQISCTCSSKLSWKSYCIFHCRCLAWCWMALYRVWSVQCLNNYLWYNTQTIFWKAFCIFPYRNWE